MPHPATTMGFLRRLTLAAALAAALPAAASGLVVQVTDQHGAAVADAVVSLSGAAAALPAPPPATRTIDQKDERFVPYVEAFRPGDKVVFHNSDSTRHHVYSFAPLKSFEFVLAPGATSAPITLDRAGAAAVGCNIHDQMIAWLYVSDAPWSARTGADGRVQLPALAAGDYILHAWHPQLRPGQRALEQPLTLPASAPPSLVLKLLPDPRLRHDPERARY